MSRVGGSDMILTALLIELLFGHPWFWKTTDNAQFFVWFSAYHPFQGFPIFQTGSFKWLANTVIWSWTLGLYPNLADHVRSLYGIHLCTSLRVQDVNFFLQNIRDKITILKYIWYTMRQLTQVPHIRAWEMHFLFCCVFNACPGGLFNHVDLTAGHFIQSGFFTPKCKMLAVTS